MKAYGSQCKEAGFGQHTLLNSALEPMKDKSGILPKRDLVTKRAWVVDGSHCTEFSMGDEGEWELMSAKYWQPINDPIAQASWYKRHVVFPQCYWFQRSRVLVSGVLSHAGLGHLPFPRAIGSICCNFGVDPAHLTQGGTGTPQRCWLRNAHGSILASQPQCKWFSSIIFPAQQWTLAWKL